jgi:hypothetical protein
MTGVSQWPEPERRQHRRYIVGGTVVIKKPGEDSVARLVNIGPGGLLIRRRTQLQPETVVLLEIQPEHYGERIKAKGRIVGGKEDLLAIKFMTEPAGMDELLHSLQEANCTWTGPVEICQ